VKNGTVKFFNGAKGFGFIIEDETKEEFFVHVSGLIDKINEGDKIEFGNSSLDVLFGPGHAPGHIAFYSPEDKFVINGDILFQGSFGRVDLPGGDFQTLKKTILETMFALPDDTMVYTGHGPETTIGAEKETNPINWMEV